jgi:hypothetical protein
MSVRGVVQCRYVGGAGGQLEPTLPMLFVVVYYNAIYNEAMLQSDL